jgi:hypothetical protein
VPLAGSCKKGTVFSWFIGCVAGAKVQQSIQSAYFKELMIGIRYFYGKPEQAVHMANRWK